MVLTLYFKYLLNDNYSSTALHVWYMKYNRENHQGEKCNVSNGEIKVIRFLFRDNKFQCYISI